jgi:predicted MPP superfamily phosphohydrolase
MSLFTAASLGAWLVVVANAFLVRGRFFAIFGAVVVGMYTLAATAIASLVRPMAVWPLFLGLHAVVYVHLLMLARPVMRPILYRALISIPASFFLAGTLLSLPWGIAASLGFHPPAPYVPYVLGLLGVWQSLTSRWEDTHLVIDDVDVPGLLRHRPQGERVERPLRIVQISDPHLGPFMSVERLRGICERAVQAQPDLVVLTGDFLTMESQGTVEHLRRALEPLAVLPGRVYACRGNHDLEAPRVVDEALRSHGIRLLIDEEATVDTPWGELDLLGFDFVFRDREAHVSRVAAEHPRRSERLRIALLHDPTAFRFLPSGEADLVLSGHMHGGQLGLLSIGATWTVPRLFDVPDHGLWARGRNRMYLHRGTGHYGFPLRLGVPSEEGVIHIHWRGRSLKEGI